MATGCSQIRATRWVNTWGLGRPGGLLVPLGSCQAPFPLFASFAPRRLNLDFTQLLSALSPTCSWRVYTFWRGCSLPYRCPRSDQQLLCNVSPMWGVPSKCSPSHSPSAGRVWWLGACPCFPSQPLKWATTLMTNVNLRTSASAEEGPTQQAPQERAEGSQHVVG